MKKSAARKGWGTELFYAAIHPIVEMDEWLHERNSTSILLKYIWLPDYIASGSERDGISLNRCFACLMPSLAIGIFKKVV